MNRGDLVIGVFPGEYGKPRPAVVIQTSATAATHPSITLCPLTTDLRQLPNFRIRVAPSGPTGLRKTSEVMTDNVQTLPRTKIRSRIGSLDAETMRALDTALRVWLGLA